MKIAFLTPEFPHPKTGVSGGIGTSIMNLSQGLVNAGHEVVLLVYGQDQDEVFEDGNLIFYRIKNRKFARISWYLTRKKIEKLINSLYEEKKIDAVEAPDWTGITSFLNTECPVTIRLHGSDTYFCHLENRKVKWFNRFHEKRALQKADALLSVSRFTADMTNKIFSLDKHFTVIPNCIDPAKFTASEPVSSQKILYFGTLIRKKGLLELPLIFNEVHKSNPLAELILVGRDSGDTITGNPSVWEMMKPLFSPEAFEKVTYAGGVHYDKMKNYIAEASVCVFPTFAEALPLSWIEAMAMQKAVVASDIGWATEVIEDGKTGFLVNPKSHIGFAEKITLLLENDELRNRIGMEARRSVIQKFDIAPVALQNIHFYQSLIKS